MTIRASSLLRLAGLATAFAALSLLLVRWLGSPIVLNLAPAGPARVGGELLAVSWWLLGGRLAVLLARATIALGSPSREARLLSDLVAGAIAVATGLAVIAFVFALPVRGLLATSGVIAIVLGLALQNTLGDLFAGIAVGIERPYGPGDTLTVDGVTGVVTEINWRSTHLLVGRDSAVVPNSVVARARLLNRSAPDPSTAAEIELTLDPAVPPEDALVVLEAALGATVGFAPGSTSRALCTALGGDRISFTMQFAAPNSDAVAPLRSALLARAHRHLRFAGMQLAIPGLAPPGWSAGGAHAAIGIDDLLTQSELFGAMQPNHRALIGLRFEALELAAGEQIFREGDQPEALFMIAGGTMEMITGALDAPATCYRLSPGETMAAVALITGQPQRATARAVTATRLFRLHERALAACVANTPNLEADLEGTVERALRAMARQIAGRSDAEVETPDAFSYRLSAFFQRLRAIGAER